MQKNLPFYILTLLILNFQLLIINSLSAQTVTNVTAVQEGKAIKISYDLDKAADVSVFVSTNGGFAFVELHEVSGAVGENVKEGHNEIVWNVLGERENLIFDNVVFKIKAKSLVPECPTFVSDYDGNSYKTVLIGTQCWMKENLRTTHYADGTSISLGNTNTTSTTAAYRYYPNNNSSNFATYGYLYNWKAVMGNSTSSNSNPSGVQGICPNGWHVPSDAEWTQLTDYVGSKSEYVCGNNNNYIAKALAATTGWNSCPLSCAVGSNQRANNATGFGALPAGTPYGGYYDFGRFASFWSATQYDSDSANGLHLDYGSADVNRYYDYKDDGYSVRCLHD